MKPKHIKQLQAQSKKLHVRRVDKQSFIVESGTDARTHYVVTVTFDGDGIIYTRCTCPWSQHNGFACSHALATLEFLAAKRERTLSFWLSREEAERQKHRTFYLAADEKDHNGIWITSRGA